MDLTNMSALDGGFATFFFTRGLFMLLLFFALYIYSALALMYIAKKTRTPNNWLAWIPIANFYLLTQMAGVSGLWTLILLAAFVPFVGGLAIMVCTVWLFWQIAEKIDFPGWTSLLILVPVLNLVMLGIYAWYK